MPSKLETMLNELIENMSTRHVNHAELEPIKQEILQEALKQKSWVSVDKRLPDESGEYLVYCIGDSGFAKDRKARSVMLFNVEKNIWASLSPIFKVTHWQALPNPPSEVQSE